MKIVIAGGSGFLGRALIKTLPGDDIRILTRRPRNSTDIAWSPTDVEGAWRANVDGADAVVNLAGEGIADRRWTPERKAAIRDSRVTATRALVNAITAARTPPPVFISSSAIGIYGNRGDEQLDEDSTLGSDFLADVCRAWESEANAASTVTRVVLLRTGVVLARGGGALPQMAMPFKFFVGGRVGTGRQYMSWIHLDDWVGLVGWALADQRVNGPVNLTAPNPVTNADFTRALGRAMRRPALIPAPAFALRLAFGEMADALLLGGQKVLPQRAQRLGFNFRYPTLDRALAAIYK